MSCGVGCRHCLDLALLWLWHRLSAVAPIQLLAWEPPYATDADLKGQKQKTQIKDNLYYSASLYHKDIHIVLG